LAIFGSKFGHFGPKMAFWAHFDQTGHDICPILAMETSLMFYYYNYLLYVLTKIWFGQFWPFFVIFGPKFCPFGRKMAFWAHFGQTGHESCPIFAMEIAMMFYYYNYLLYMLEKSALAIFASKFVHFEPKIAFWAHSALTGHDICQIFCNGI
jgi:hypothetical protein